jgi:hypothetical protein
MELPINEKELKKIIKILKNADEKDLYSKLWTFNFNRENKKS